MSSRLGRWVVSVIVVVAIVTAVVSLDLRERQWTALDGARPWPITWTDDSFYSASVAYHLERGEGSTIDGRTRTNGYQPLWVWLIAGIGRVLGPLERRDLVRLAVVLGLGIALAAGAVFWMVLRAVVSGAAGGFGGRPILLTSMFVVYLASPSTVLYDANGLETRLAALLLLAVLLLWIGPFWQGRAGAKYALGITATVLFFARTDMVFALASLGTADLLFRWRREGVLRAWITAGACTTVGVAPYLLWNRLQFGSIMPVSGLANIALGASAGLGGVIRFALSEAELFLVFYFPNDLSVPRVVKFVCCLVLLGFVVLALVGGRRRAVVEPASPEGREIAGVLLLTTALYGGVLFTYYGLVQRFGEAARYAEPFRVCVLLTGAALAARAAASAARSRVIVASAILIAGAALTVGAHAAFFAPIDTRDNAFVDLADTIDHVGLRGRTIAVFQSGYLGFWIPGVVNLDGKVNPAAVVATTAGHLDEWIARSDIDLVTDAHAYQVSATALSNPWIGDLARRPAIGARFRETWVSGAHHTWMVLERGTSEP